MSAGQHLRENAFFVLGASPDAERSEIERTGQRLLGELSLGRKEACTYRTPLGVEERTAERVRAALADLRDPVRRLSHEIWARVPASTVEPVAPPFSWALAERILGVRR
jgi:hypothetical protein